MNEPDDFITCDSVCDRMTQRLSDWKEQRRKQGRKATANRTMRMLYIMHGSPLGDCAYASRLWYEMNVGTTVN